jgi:hypothetical protein
MPRLDPLVPGVPCQDLTPYLLGFFLFVLGNRYRQIQELSLDESRLFGVRWRSTD